MRILAILLILPLGAPPLHAAEGDLPTAAELSRTFRSLLLPNLPSPLVAQSYNWGHQEMGPIGLKWEKKGILLKPEVVKALRNDGMWRKVEVVAFDPANKLEVRVKDVALPEPGRLTFAMEVHMPVRVKLEQQLWQNGKRLYSGETRARSWVILTLKCESLSRLEKKPGSLLPDLVMRLRVQEAKLTYYDFVTEHTAGVGGDLARLFGDAVHEAVKSWKPDLEKDLLAKANAAIVKAGDTKEVRVSLSKLFEKK